MIEVKWMTIVEAIVTVLKNEQYGLSSEEVYSEIVKQKYYTFGAKNPQAVVNGQIRRRCQGLNFPTAYPVKLFCIVGYKGKKPLFSLLSAYNKSAQPKIAVSSNSDILPEEKIGAAFDEHIKTIKQQVFDLVLNNSPEFFEQLVMDLL